MKPNFLKKISTKTALTDNNFRSLAGITPIMRITGIARGLKVGEHAQYGRYVKFSGEFVAIDLREGTVSASSVAFLPAPADDMIESALAANPEGSGIEFAFDISVKPRPDTPIGYEYIVNSLVDSQPSNPMQELLNRVGVPQIAATGQLPLEDKPEPAKAEGKGKAKHA